MNAVELLSAGEKHLLGIPCGIAVVFRIDELREAVSRGVLIHGEEIIHHHAIIPSYQGVGGVRMNRWEGWASIVCQVL